MEGTSPVLWQIDARGVARVEFNRPHVNNAYDGALIDGILATLNALSTAAGLRAVVLSGRGRHFQAGADLQWIRQVREQDMAANVRASRMTAEAIRRLGAVSVPTIALVQGACFGGGTGIVAACDVVVAAENAVFSIAEVRWGLTAAIIIPQLSDAIGVRQVRRYAVTGERFDAKEARRIGLVHEVVPPGQLLETGERVVGHVLGNGPEAIRETKSITCDGERKPLTAEQFDALIIGHAAKRCSEEAGEGLASFVEKREASWVTHHARRNDAT